MSIKHNNHASMQNKNVPL